MLSFEAALKRLEQIVKQLEDGDLALDSALKLFEEGIQLAQQCQKQLKEAEDKVEILIKRADGKVVARPFQPEVDTAQAQTPEGEEEES